MLKHFFIVGAQRCATTYLYHILDEHPEINMAKPIFPEPKFLLQDQLYKKGINYYQKHYFKNKPGAWLCGEKSTSYLECEKAARRIAKYFPDAKIIILLRNPIDRAISNYNFSCQNGLEKYSIEDALTKKELLNRPYDNHRTSVSPYNYLKRGSYINYILLYNRYFRPKNIKVLIAEKMINSFPQIADLYDFLGVNQNFKPHSLNKRFNESKTLTKIPTELKQCLRRYYQDSNNKLGQYLKLSLKEWEL